MAAVTEEMRSHRQNERMRRELIFTTRVKIFGLTESKFIHIAYPGKQFWNFWLRSFYFIICVFVVSFIIM